MKHPSKEVLHDWSKVVMERQTLPNSSFREEPRAVCGFVTATFQFCNLKVLVIKDAAAVDVLSLVEVLTHLKQWRQQTWVSCVCISASTKNLLCLVVSVWTDPEEFSFLYRELCWAQNPPDNMLLGFGTSEDLSYCYSVTQTPWECIPASLNTGQMSQTAQIEPNPESWLSKLNLTKGNSAAVVCLEMYSSSSKWLPIGLCGG